MTKKYYYSKQNEVKNQALDYITWLCNEQPALSYGELADIQGYFETMGRKYGLLKEFHENAIC